MNRLSRSGAPARPVRAVHLGLGAFHRAHQAWYTMHDPEWGIAAYSFRSTELPRVLGEQDGLYSLHTDSPVIVDSLSRVHPGSDTQRWLSDMADKDIALLTLTITEAGYTSTHPHSALERVVHGLRARYLGSGAPLAVVPCDNLPHNGAAVRAAVESLASADNGFRSWLDRRVSYVDTVVDRITPAPDGQPLQVNGMLDRAPVVAEPYSEWLFSGEFPLGRPEWERAGARGVSDLSRYQQRKLWFLNGAHSLLAYVGLARGHTSIDEAVGDPLLRGLMESWWDTAARHADLSPTELDDYRSQLRARFASTSIRHRLSQIAIGGEQKIAARILPVLRAERAAGRIPSSAVAVLACWLLHSGPGATLSAIDPELPKDHELCQQLDDYHVQLTE